jgi:cysteinyl-tRNA synthetase
MPEPCRSRAAAALIVGGVLRLYDSATREVRELALREPGKVSIYLCGPTVYAPPHLGHGRATVEYDVLARYLRWQGFDVRLVSNVTDIDDRIIERANREQRPWDQITERCERVWWMAMDGLGVAHPDDIPHATAYVDKMVAMIGELVDIGRAYTTDDGVYLSVESVEDYGLLAHQSLDELVAGGGEREVYGAESKRHPGDFALWKLSKPGEPAWPSPWGDGRPGWHTECVVMSLDLLGEEFDLHAGGMDLRFPHHENERAQAVALGKRFARHWMHNGFVIDAEGEKMSKSLGNVDNLLDLLDRYDGRAYRLLLMQSHYRSPVLVGAENLEAAQNALAGLDAFAARSAGIGETDRKDADPAVLEAFVSAMDDDLDTPTATALIFDTVRRANAALDRNDPAARSLVAAVREMASAVGLELRRTEEVPGDVLERAAAIDAARAAKDYATADSIRAELQGEGWMVETTPGGTSVRR